VIAIASVLYVLLGSGIGRSSYTVLGALGLFLVTSHFVFKWFLPFRISFFSEESETTKPWAAALSYAVYGLFLMLLGMWIARRRGAAVAV
jgi:Sec-independent protein secretion pathway component TatC